jgi:heme/copper-type cytochrome/quinol oxidase subunit 1
MKPMPDHTPEPRPMRVMDWLVVSLVICAVILPMLMASASPDARPRIESAAMVLAVAGCVLMLAWMSFADGAHSKVWSFLPPFWPWSRYAAGPVSRWVIVILLVAGTVMGIFSARFAR